MLHAPPSKAIRRILVIAYGHTQDTLPAGPCLASLRAVYADAQLHMLVVSEVAELWRACPYVDHVRVMRDFRWKGSRLARFERLWRLGLLTARVRGRYDLVLVLHAGTAFFTRLAYLSGARYRAGFIDNLPGHWLTHHAKPARHIMSFREENRRIVEALGIMNISRRLEIWPTAKARAEVTTLLGSVDAGGPLICLHPGSHWACQRWHNDRWAVVADALADIYAARVVITGSSDERELAEDITRHMHTRPLIATGATSLLGFAELVARSQLLICVNSAASQIGLAVKTPVVNLIGLEPLTWTQPEPDEAMTLVQKSVPTLTPWCSWGVWGRLSQCQRADHVALAGLDSIQPHHALSAVTKWLSPDGQPAEAGI